MSSVKQALGMCASQSSLLPREAGARLMVLCERCAVMLGTSVWLWGYCARGCSSLGSILRGDPHHGIRRTLGSIGNRQVASSALA